MDEKIFIIGSDVFSQTGKALLKRYPDTNPANIGFCTFEQIVHKQRTAAKFLGVCPIWNSNCGYVRNSNLIFTIFDDSIRVLIDDIWLDKIDFYHGYKNAVQPGKPVTSVSVAKYQCSEWLKRQHIFKSFSGKDNTSLAMREYLSDLLN